MRQAIDLQATIRAYEAMAVAMRRVGWTLGRYRLRWDGNVLKRPDGRVRRSGHRHRGTLAWRMRHNAG